MSDPQWVKATRSAGDKACIELALIGDDIGVRDSKNPSNHLLFSRAEIKAFLDGFRKGEFDHLLYPDR